MNDHCVQSNRNVSATLTALSKDISITPHADYLLQIFLFAIYVNQLSIGLAQFSAFVSLCCVVSSTESLYFTNGLDTLRPSKMPLPLGDLDPHLLHDSLNRKVCPHKLYVNQFSQFCRAHPSAQHTHTHTPHYVQHLQQ